MIDVDCYFECFGKWYSLSWYGYLEYSFIVVWFSVLLTMLIVALIALTYRLIVFVC